MKTFKFSPGSAADGALVTNIGNEGEEDALFGANSQVAGAVRAFRAVNKVRGAGLGHQTFRELREALTFYAVERNLYAVEHIVKEMAARRRVTGAEMAAAIKRGEF